MADWTKTALLLCDLQNDFLHPRGAYGRAGQSAPEIAALPTRLRPLMMFTRTMTMATTSRIWTKPPMVVLVTTLLVAGLWLDGAEPEHPLTVSAAASTAATAGRTVGRSTTRR